MAFVSSFLLFKQCCYEHTCPWVLPFTFEFSAHQKCIFLNDMRFKSNVFLFFFFFFTSTQLSHHSLLISLSYPYKPIISSSLLISNFPLVRCLLLRVASYLGYPREEGERSRWRKGLSGGGADPQPHWVKPLPLSSLFYTELWNFKTETEDWLYDWKLSLTALDYAFHNTFQH